MKESTELVFESAKGRKYDIEANIITSYDSHYGADADGRRGVATTFIDDAEINEIVSQKTGNHIPERLLSKEYLQKIYGHILNMAEVI